MVKKRTLSSAKTQDDMETNVATTEDSETYETVNTEDDTDNEEMTLRPTTSRATAEAKYSDDNGEMTLRPTTSKAIAEAKYNDDNDEMTMTLRPRLINFLTELLSLLEDQQLLGIEDQMYKQIVCLKLLRKLHKVIMRDCMG